MKTCKSCKTQIDSSASKCPHCGTDQRNFFSRHKILSGIVVVIIVLGILGAIGGSKSGNSTPSSGSNTGTNNSTGNSASPAAKQAPIVIDATALVGEYDKNKLAAQDKYTGKVVQTTAFIENISSDITGSYYLSLKPSNDQAYFGTTMQCYFNDKSALTSLANGQSVTVMGTMQDMSIGIVEMKDCSLVK